MKRFTSVVWLLSASAAFCAELPPEQAEFFENKIRPVLAERCYGCHSTEAGKDKGGLLLDSRDALLKGGDTGPALVAGDASQSLLFKAIKREDPETAMPPKGKTDPLTAEQVADFEAWIKMGAPDPRTVLSKKPSSTRCWRREKTIGLFNLRRRKPFLRDRTWWTRCFRERELWRNLECSSAALRSPLLACRPHRSAWRLL